MAMASERLRPPGRRRYGSRARWSAECIARGMDRHLSDKVVVITGASSGLGRETALAFARHGARVVCAARHRAHLDKVATSCRELGAQALVVETDVTNEAQVGRLVRVTMDHFGRIDIWINDAGVTEFGSLEDGPFEHHRRVVETNVIGPMLAAKLVMPIFRAQEWGVFINIGSILSKIGQPFVPSYVVSKFAIRGLSEALRTELAEYPNIHACTVLPYTIDTPHFELGANELGRRPFAMPPMQSPEKVARAVVDLARHPRREVHVPKVAALGLVLHWMFPDTTEKLLLRALRTWHFNGRQAAPDKQGNLYRPGGEGTGHGHRPPQIGTPRFAGWVLRELIRIEAENLSSWRRGGARDATV
jgi:NAD(P)-dependent dehydrogenase (short-subunit alcohol dehydrogenase family)